MNFVGVRLFDLAGGTRTGITLIGDGLGVFARGRCCTS
jgi:hypothetical protein